MKRAIMWCDMAVGSHIVITVFMMVSMVTAEDAYSEVEFPDPRRNFTSCGVSKFSYICDPGHRLTKDNLEELNRLIRTVQDVDTCLCEECGLVQRHTIMVAVLPRIKYVTGEFPKTDKEEIQAVRQFAEHLRDELWSVNYVGCPLLAYIVYDAHTDRIWTATNINARKVITNDQAGEISLAAKEEYFTRGLIYEGLRDMITKYKELLMAGIPGMPWWKILLIVLGVLAGLGLLCCCCCCCRGGGGRGRGGVFGGLGGGSGCGGGCGGGGCGGGGGG